MSPAPSAVPPSSDPELSVLIAAFDEEENLEAVIDEVVAVLEDEVSFEVIVVDDGSRDGSLVLLQRLAAEDPRLRIRAHRRCRGKSAGLVTGARVARGAWLGTMDGDGQNDPADLLVLYREARRRTQEEGGMWIAAGQRRRRRDTWSKRLQSRIANRIRRALLHDVTPDTGCGLKVLPTELFLALPRFAHMHRFLPALVRQQGGSVVSIPVEDRPRVHGVSKYGFGNRLWVGVTDLLGVIWLGRRTVGPFESGGPE